MLTEEKEVEITAEVYEILKSHGLTIREANTITNRVQRTYFESIRERQEAMYDEKLK